MNTPTLRFKEFSGAWEVKSLGDLAQIYDGTHMTPDYQKSGIPFYSVEHITSDNFQETKFISREVFEKENKRVKLEKGDILMTKIGDIGTPKYIDWDVEASFYVSLALIKQSPKANFLYLSHYIRTSFFQNELHKKIIHVVFPKKINLGEISNCMVNLPTLPEQTKIANFLTAIDEKIAQLSQTAQLLTDYKKGVMQQIFSQQLRFKDDDGREFDEWDFIELEKLAFKVNAKNKDFSITNVLTNSATQGIVNQADYFDRDIANHNNLGGYYVVEIDDFVYNPRISNHALVGSLKRNNLVKGVMSPLYTVFRFKNGSLSFFEQYFETTHWHDYMKSVANSGARHDRLNITNDDFLNLPVPFPSLPEQTKIANFLTAIDDKINHNQTQLDAMKHYKSGLLQQMFV